VQESATGIDVSQRAATLRAEVRLIRLAKLLPIVMGVAIVTGTSLWFLAALAAVLVIVLVRAAAEGWRLWRRDRLLAEHDYCICSQCEYPVWALPSDGRCPECGTTFSHQELRQYWIERQAGEHGEGPNPYREAASAAGAGGAHGQSGSPGTLRQGFGLLRVAMTAVVAALVAAAALFVALGLLMSLSSDLLFWVLAGAIVTVVSVVVVLRVMRADAIRAIRAQRRRDCELS